MLQFLGEVKKTPNLLLDETKLCTNLKYAQACGWVGCGLWAVDWVGKVGLFWGHQFTEELKLLSYDLIIEILTS